MTNSTDHTAHPRLVPLAWVFVRYANFTLGGGSATTAVLHHEVVGKRRWITEDRFILCFALGRLTPGTNLLAFCTGVGWLLRGGVGAIVALLAASIPCTIMVIVLTALFSEWQDNQFAQSAIHGAISAAVAITIKTVWTISKPHFKGRERIRVIIVGAIAFALYVVVGLSAIEVLLIAAAVGTLWPAERT